MKTRNRPSKYDQHLEYVQKHIVSDGIEAVAKHLGILRHGLRFRIAQWRKKGIVIPRARDSKIGDTHTRSISGIVYVFEKTAEGWKRAGRITPYRNREATEHREPKFNQPRKEKAVAAPKRAPKPEPKKYADRVIPFNPEIHQMIKINNKTWKQVLKTA